MSNTGRTHSTRLAAQLRPSILRLSRTIRQQAVSRGASSLHIQILHAIQVAPGITVAELAAAEQITRPTMSEHIKRLVLRGYVKRADADTERPGSPVCLTVTRTGRQFLEGVARRDGDWLTERLSLLSAAERLDLDRATRSLQLILDASNTTA